MTASVGRTTVGIFTDAKHGDGVGWTIRSTLGPLLKIVGSFMNSKSTNSKIVGRFGRLEVDSVRTLD